MALILAIEPDQRQAAVLKRIVREQVGADLVLVDSRDGAIAAIADRMPDVILTTVLLSPRDEEELVAHLRTLEGAEHLQTYTIPQLASGAEETEGRSGGLFGKFRRKKDVDPIGGCDPDHFAQEIKSHLERAADARVEAAAARQRRAANPPVAAARPRDAGSADSGEFSQWSEPRHEPETSTVPSGSAWASPFEWRPAEQHTAPPADPQPAMTAGAFQSPAIDQGAGADAPTHPALVTNMPLAVVAEEEELAAQARQAELERLAAEADERRRREEEERARQAEEERRQLEERKRQIEEERRQIEAERKRLEAEAAEARRREEEERRRREEEERQRLEAEAARRRREEEERRRREDEERRRLEAEAAARRKREEEERRRRELEEKRRREREEEERRRIEAEAAARRKREEEERKRREQEARKRLEAEAAARRKREEEERLRREREEAERRKREAEAARRKREEEERARREREEAERKRLEAEAAARRKREEEERRRKAEEEERKRVEAEAAARRKREEEERRRKAQEEERRRQEAEAAARRKREEEERRRKAEEEKHRRQEAEAAARKKREEEEARRKREEAERAAAKARQATEAAAPAAAPAAEKPSRPARTVRRRSPEPATPTSIGFGASTSLDGFSEFRAGVERTSDGRPAPGEGDDPFAEFREDHDQPKGVLRLMPLSEWARLENRRSNGQKAAPQDDCTQLLSALTVPPQVALVSYPRGCRIRRVRVRTLEGAPPEPAGRGKPLIVSRRALREDSAGGTARASDR